MSVLAKVLTQQRNRKLGPPTQALPELATSLSFLSCLEFILSRLLHLILHLTAQHCLNNTHKLLKSSNHTVTMVYKKHVKLRPPAALRPYRIKPKAFLARNKQYTNLAVGSFIFYPVKADILPPPAYYPDKGVYYTSASYRPIESRLLILQRARSETFPNPWEVPGGGCELIDPTILHSVARQTFEQTGLDIRRFLRQIRDREEFETNEGSCCKLNFEIGVAELAGVDKMATCTTLDDVKVILNPDEHQEFVWATEEDIRDDIFPIVTPEQKAVIMQAFQLRREAREELVELAASAVSALKAPKNASHKYDDAVDLGEDADDDDEDDDGDDEKDNDDDEKDDEPEDEAVDLSNP